MINLVIIRSIDRLPGSKLKDFDGSFDTPIILCHKRPEITPAVFGNMARDGGHLIIEEEDYETAMADPVAAKYVRSFRGSRELIRGLDRCCFVPC